MTGGHREGFSLMEVILAMSILLGGVIVLGKLAFIGSKHARNAEDLATAQLLCEARMSEILSGLTALQPVDEEPLLDNPGWMISTEILPSEQPGISTIQITVTQKDKLAESLIESSAKPKKNLSFTLVRWIADQGVESSGFPGGTSP